MPSLGALAALVRADYLVARSYRLALLFGLFAGLANLSVFYFISKSLVAANPGQLQGAPDYFAYAAVGVSLTLVLRSTSAQLAQRIREEQLTGTFELLVAQPLSPAELALGMVGWPFFYSALRAAVYLFVAALVLGLDVSNADWPGFALVMGASALALTSMGIVLGALVVVFKRAEALIGFFTFAVGFLGGAFFPVEALPGWLQPLSDFVPTTRAFEGVRGALFTGTNWGGPTVDLLIFAAVGMPVALLLFGRALAYTRRRGTLSQF
jgi:ABC-2 type transport system permease protein